MSAAKTPVMFGNMAYKPRSDPGSMTNSLVPPARLKAIPRAASTWGAESPSILEAATVAENDPSSTGSIHSRPWFSSGSDTANPRRHITSSATATAVTSSLPEACTRSPAASAAGTTEADGWTNASS